jgi:DHA1 family inner membrane transport protein
MTSGATPLVAAEPEHQFLPAVWALGVGAFAIGTGEFVTMGLLPEVAVDLRVTVPQAGHVISAYALGVVLGAPLLAVVTANLPRRRLLIALMALFALGNFASAMAPSYLALSFIRWFTGLPHGAYFGVAALVAASLAPANRRASAVGMVMLGLTSATLFGVPLAAWLGQHWGWRAAFALVGAIASLTCVLVRGYVPEVPAAQGASPLRELGALARPQVWLTLGIAAVGFGGMFAVFSYISRC